MDPKRGVLVVLAVLVVSMCVRIWRSSPALAVVTFFFWPASVLALFSNWGDRDSDIRIPFALALLTAGLVRGDERALQGAGYVAELAFALAGTRAMPLLPRWDAAHALATWQRGGEDGTAHAFAARVLPHGVLVFSARGLAAEHLELATRSVRLLALRAAPLPAATSRAHDAAGRSWVIAAR